MNINKLRASGMRHVMEIKGTLEGNPHHQEHIRDFCNYADAVSQGEADEVRQEIPQTVQKEVQKQMNSNKVQVEVDKQSVKAAKKAIDDVFSSIRKLFG